MLVHARQPRRVGVIQPVERWRRPRLIARSGPAVCEHETHPGGCAPAFVFTETEGPGRIRQDAAKPEAVEHLDRGVGGGRWITGASQRLEYGPGEDDTHRGRVVRSEERTHAVR